MKLTQVCEHCGASFRRVPFWKSREFCSAECESASRKKIMAFFGEDAEAPSAPADEPIEVPPLTLTPLSAFPSDVASMGKAVSAAGAVESPAPPEEPEELGRDLGKVICFLSAQGGAGGSTLALHVAKSIGDWSESRVLLMDQDYHCGTLPFRLGLKPSATIADLPEGEIDEAALQSIVSAWGPLDVVAGPPNELGVGGRIAKQIPHVLKTARERYAHIVIDHPASIYSDSFPLLKQADIIYLTCSPEATSLFLARRKAKLLRGAGISPDRLVLVVNRGTSWGALSSDDVSRISGLTLRAVFENDYQAVRRANWKGGLVAEDSVLGRQFHEFAGKVMQDLEPSRAAAETAENPVGAFSSA